MKNILLKCSAIILSFTILSTSILSCSSTTRITSIPDGAKIYIDDELVGTTPYRHTDYSVAGSTKTIELKKEGYQDFQTEIKKNERAHVGAIIGGCFLLFPFIWVVQYDTDYTFELTPGSGAN